MTTPAIEAALRELLASLRQGCGVESAMALADAALAEQPREERDEYGIREEEAEGNYAQGYHDGKTDAEMARRAEQPRGEEERGVESLIGELEAGRPWSNHPWRNADEAVDTIVKRLKKIAADEIAQERRAEAS